MNEGEGDKMADKKTDSSKGRTTTVKNDTRTVEVQQGGRQRVTAVAPLVIATKPVGGFVGFLREQAVVGLAIGLVLGTQAKQIVDALTANFINPLVGLLTPGTGDLAKKTFAVHYGEKTGVFGWGAFVATLISFIIVAAVVYFVIKGLKLDKLDKPKE